MESGNCTKFNLRIIKIISNGSHSTMETLFSLPKLPVVVIYYPETKDNSEDKKKYQEVAEELAKQIAGEKNLPIEMKLRGSDPLNSLGRRVDFDLAIVLQTNESISEWQHGFERTLPVRSLINVVCQKLSDLKIKEEWVPYYKEENSQRSHSKIVERIRELLEDQLKVNKQFNLAIVNLEKEKKPIALAKEISEKVKKELKTKEVICFGRQDTSDAVESREANQEKSVGSEDRSIYFAKFIIVFRSAESAETVDPFLDKISKVRRGVVVVNLGLSLIHI